MHVGCGISEECTPPSLGPGNSRRMSSSLFQPKHGEEVLAGDVPSDPVFAGTRWHPLL